MSTPKGTSAALRDGSPPSSSTGLAPDLPIHQLRRSGHAIDVIDQLLIGGERWVG